MAKAIAKRSASTQTIAKRMAENEQSATPELANDPAMLNAIFAAFKAKTGKDMTVSLSTLDGIIERAGDQWDTMTDEEQVKFLQSAQGEVVKVAVSDPAISSLVRKLEDDTEFTRELDACIEAVKKSKTTAPDVYGQFKRIYSVEEMDAMAWPGTKSETDYLKGTNRRADIVEKTDRQSGAKVTTKWIEDFVAAHSKGKAYDAAIATAQKELKSSGSVPSLKHLGKRDLTAIVKENTTDRNAFRSMVRRAIAIHHKLRQIEMMPQVVLQWTATQTNQCTLIPAKYGTGKHAADDLKVTRSPSPFWLFPKSDPGAGKPYSVTQIINMDVDAAIAAGGTVKDLLDTIATGAGDEAGDGDGSDWDVDEANEGLSKAVNYFKVKANRSAMAKKLTALDDPKASADEKKEAEELLENIGDLFSHLSPHLRKHRAKYDELVSASKGTTDEAIAA